MKKKTYMLSSQNLFHWHRVTAKLMTSIHYVLEIAILNFLKHRIFWLQNPSKRKDIAVYHSTSSTLIVSPKLQKGVNNKWIQKFIRVWKEDQNQREYHHYRCHVNRPCNVLEFTKKKIKQTKTTNIIPCNELRKKPCSLPIGTLMATV